VPYERITQAWRFSSWPDGHFSHVTIKITQGDGKTHLELRHSGVPAEDAERTKQGWSAMQFQRLKMVLGYSSGLPF
jgi:activator of HSP90 ATPase